MTNDTEQIIKNYPGISIEDARMIFIRNLGRDAFKNRNANALEAIMPPTPIKDGSREQVIQYLGFLDTMIKELKVYQQGLEIEYAKEVEPEIEKAHQERQAEKDSRKSQPETLQGHVKKAALMGMDRKALIAALQAQIDEERKEKESK